MQCINPRVARDEDAIFRYSLPQQILPRLLSGSEVEVGHDASYSAVDLLGEWSPLVESAQPCLHMAQPYAREAEATVVVSPCTSTQSGRSACRMGSSRANTAEATW